MIYFASLHAKSRQVSPSLAKYCTVPTSRYDPTKLKKSQKIVESRIPVMILFAPLYMPSLAKSREISRNIALCQLAVTTRATAKKSQKIVLSRIPAMIHFRLFTRQVSPSLAKSRQVSPSLTKYCTVSTSRYDPTKLKKSQKIVESRIPVMILFAPLYTPLQRD